MTPTRRPSSGELCRTCWMLVAFFLCCSCSSASSSSSSSRRLINKSSSSNNNSRVVTHLPGFDGPLPFHLQTGYVEVDEGNGVRLFYYFVRSERSPADDPLMLWLTGGPGCSVLTGLAYEIGPLSFDVNGAEDADGLPKLLYRTDTWTKVSNIIFLDSPVGAGFSYSVTEQGYRSSDTKAIDQILIFLRKWLGEHPEFLSNPLYIGGDSYAGMIVPTVASQIARGIEVGSEPALNLKGYLVGNPVTDSNFDGPSKIPFAHGKGLISDELYETYRKSCGAGGDNAPVWNRLVSASIGIEHITPQAALYGIKSPAEAVSNRVVPNGDSSYPSIECAVSLYIIDECLRGICPNHILEPLCAFASPHPDTTTDAEPRLSEITLQCRTAGYLMSRTWANNASVREALGIHKGTVPSWIRCNYGLPYAADIPSSVKYHLDVTTRGYRSLVYSGDHDMVIPFIGTQAWIKSLGFAVVDKWRPWYVDGQVAGYTRSYANNLTFATVKGGGHTAPEYMPRQCFEMFERWISGGPL